MTINRPADRAEDSHDFHTSAPSTVAREQQVDGKTIHSLRMTTAPAQPDVIAGLDKGFGNLTLVGDSADTKNKQGTVSQHDRHRIDRELEDAAIFFKHGDYGASGKMMAEAHKDEAALARSHEHGKPPGGHDSHGDHDRDGHKNEHANHDRDGQNDHHGDHDGDGHKDQHGSKQHHEDPQSVMNWNSKEIKSHLNDAQKAILEGDVEKAMRFTAEAQSELKAFVAAEKQSKDGSDGKGTGSGSGGGDGKGSGSGNGAGGGTGSGSGGTDAGNGNKPKIIVVNLENTSLDQILGNKNAPYINSLIEQGMLYDKSTGRHGSYTNYVEQLAGNTLGTQGYFTGNLTAPNVIDQLLAQGKSEGLSPDQIAGQFDENLKGQDWVSRHDGFLGFNSLANSGLIHDFSDFGKGGYDKLPEVSFVTPDLVDDMHGTGGMSRDQLIAKSDQWLKNNLSGLVNYAENNPNVRIVFTTDEADLSQPASTPVTTFVIGKGIAPGVDHAPVTQASITQGIQQAYGLGQLPNEETPPPIQF